MATPRQQFLADLKLLGHRLRVGMAILQPITEKELSAARQALRRQWERKQLQAQRRAKTKAALQTKPAPAPAVPSQQTPPPQTKRTRYHH